MWEWIEGVDNWQWIILYVMIIGAASSIILCVRWLRHCLGLRLEHQILWLKNLNKVERHYFSQINNQLKVLDEQMNDVKETIAKLQTKPENISKDSEVRTLESHLKNINKQLEQIDGMLSTSIDTSLESIAYDLDVLTIERTKESDPIPNPPNRSQPAKNPDSIKANAAKVARGAPLRP
jgi:hypothetical protein